MVGWFLAHSMGKAKRSVWGAFTRVYHKCLISKWPETRRRIGGRNIADEVKLLGKNYYAAWEENNKFLHVLKNVLEIHFNMLTTS